MLPRVYMYLQSLLLTAVSLWLPGVRFISASDVQRYDTAYECEGKILRIECREGELIHLIRANYGRFSITICNEHGNTDWSVNCMSPKSFRVLYNKCNQQQNCSILASTSQFGDPCPNTLKYLEAHYQCVLATTTTTTSRPSPPWVLTSQLSTWSTSSSTTSVTTQNSHVSSKRPKTTTSFKMDPQLIQDSPSSTPTPSAQSSIISSITPRVWTDKDPFEKEDDDGVILRTRANKGSEHASPNETIPSQKIPPASTTKFQKTDRKTPNLESSIAAFSQVCPAQVARKLAWNTTRLGETALQSCPAGANGLARWQCISQLGTKEAVWNRGTPDLSKCRSVWLSSLEKRVQDGDVILTISSDLSQVTNNSSELYGGDMLITTKIIKNMAERMTQDIKNYQDPNQQEVNAYELLQGAVTTGSNLLDKAQSASWDDLSHHEQMLVASSLLQGLEENAFLLADTLTFERSLIQERKNILIEIRVLQVRNLEKNSEVFPKELSNGNKWMKLHDQVELSKGALEMSANNGLVKLVFMAFDRLEEILQPQPDHVSFPANERFQNSSIVIETAEKFNIKQILNSKVISASLGKSKHIKLKEPVRLHFHHLTHENVSNPRCVYWDYIRNGWSEDGCITTNSNKTHTICECEHLTNFAVLMDVHAVKLNLVHRVALEVITYIGCIVSIICLILAIVTFQLFQGLKSDRTTIHKNLCICLLIAEVLFICGIEQTNQKIVCSIVAGLLHFFFLCAFAWMFLEGFQLYVMLIEVFEAEKSRLRWYYLVAYGTPFIIVLISSIIDPLSYGTDRYCWLRAENYFIFSFVGPVIIVLMANLVFLSMAIYMMCRHANMTVSMKSKEQSRLSSARAWLRGAIVLVFLLGLTWTFGLLYLNRDSVVMAYIFTVLNSLQGLFIFTFHCVQNEKVRKEYRKFVRRHSWLPKCLRCSKSTSSSGPGTSGSGTGANAGGGSVGGKDYASHNTSSNLPSAPTTDSSGLPPHTNSNNISSKSHSQGSSHCSSEQEDISRVLAHTSSCYGYGHHFGAHNTMTLHGYSLRSRERRLLAELGVGSRATTGRHRAASPYNHTYTEIREQYQQQQQLHQHHDDPVYEEIERTTGVCPETSLAQSDMSDEDGRRQSDMSRQSSRSYGDHRPLIPYSPGGEVPWALEKFKRQSQQHTLGSEQQLRPQDHTRTVAVLDGHTVVCHLQPQLDLYVGRGLAPPSYSEC